MKTVLNSGMFSDDTPVTLTGNITSSLGGDHYTFTDGTGSITVEIDHDKWFGVQVTPQTKITIHGEIDKEFNHTAIDVDHLRVVS
ncbi:NirD/YgiW/YdeI family stress tolerance protein [Photobacterium kishitanii]|uniref:NirD/YgiW/YdeI family stress tolerance protein n=1 Tax=Photobacterium kishitanii TaxID=318456 RepID=UPI002E813D4E|nr:NirD/YgiW/YdeI family stress tolerance protein [Photobacterium kishitanii]